MEISSPFPLLDADDPAAIPALFADRQEDPLLHYGRFRTPEVRDAVNQDGFAVVKGLVPPARLERLRSFWTETFSKARPDGRVTWSPTLGQKNHIGFSSDPFQHLFRSCDFLWNEPLHAETRDVCLRVHALRNLLLGESPFLGMRFTDRRYGIFITASYYPAGAGRMAVHSDSVAKRERLVHSLVPLTFKGRDYAEGGMVIVDRKGHEVDVDGRVEPGDAIFYDGALKHGVRPIKARTGNAVGRIQIFSIPTVFGDLETDLIPLSRVPLSRYLAARWLPAKNRLRLMLGLGPSMR